MPETMPCPFCTEPIREEAFRCPRCHAWLVPWSFRHKWFQGLLGLGIGVFLIYDGARERFLTGVPGWLLITGGVLLCLYGLYHLFRSPRSAFDDGRRELLQRYRRPEPEADDEGDEE